MAIIGVPGGGGPGGPWPPLAKIFSLAEQKSVAWQKKIGELKSVETSVSAANSQEISIYFNKYLFGRNKYFLAYFWEENKYILA